MKAKQQQCEGKDKVERNQSDRNAKLKRTQDSEESNATATQE
jgi:hypothetical protein